MPMNEFSGGDPHHHHHHSNGQPTEECREGDLDSPTRPFLDRSAVVSNGISESPVISPRLRNRMIHALSSFYTANYGALLVLLSQFFGCVMNLSTRLLETTGPHGEKMNPIQILFARQSITAFLCTAFALRSRSIPDFPLGAREVRPLLVARGLCGFVGVFGLYFSLSYLPLAEATILTFLAPILTCYLCSFVIKGETFSRQQQLAGFVSLLGVVFIANPAGLLAASSSSSTPSLAGDAGSVASIQRRHLHGRNGTTPISSTPHGDQTTTMSTTSSQHLLAIAVSMLGVLGGTGAMTSIRAIGTRAHPFLSINYFSVWCTIVSLGCLIAFPDVKFRLPGNLLEWGLLASLGLCGFIMQFLLTAGLAYGGPETAAVDPASSSAEDRQISRQAVAADVELRGASGNNRPSTDDADDDSSSAELQRLKRGSGTRATSMMYTQMLFALAGDKLVFSVTPGVMSWIGTGLILAGAVWVAAARDKEKRTDPQDDSTPSSFSAAATSDPGAGSVTAGRGRRTVMDVGNTNNSRVGRRERHNARTKYPEESLGLMSADAVDDEDDNDTVLEMEDFRDRRDFPTHSMSNSR